MKKTYYEQRDLSCIKRTNEIIKELPYYVRDFFVGVEPRSSTLTRLNYAYDLRVFYNFLAKNVFRCEKFEQISLNDLAQLAASDFEYFLSYLNLYELNGKNLSCTETGKARKLSTLRAFYKYFFNKNMLPANTPSKVSMPKIHEKEIVRLESNDKVDEIGDMIYVVENGEGLTKRQKGYHKSTALRDIAIITLFLGTGIRISELVGLNLTDFDFKTNSFIVTRKGGNRTVLYYNDDVLEKLIEYYNFRISDKKVGKDETAFFLSLQNKRISTRAVQELVKKYAQIISPLKKITPHKLRSTFGTSLYRQTGDIYIVADCLGHKDVNTTKKHYAAISDDLRKKVAQNLNLGNKNK